MKQENPTPAAFKTSSSQTGHQSKNQLAKIFDTHQITKMYDNGMLCDRTTLALEKAVPSSCYNDVEVNSIPSILGRPVKIVTASINNATILVSSFSMNTFNTNPMIADKLTNFNYIRGDACYKLILNAGIQTIGRILIVSSPYENSIAVNRRILGTHSTMQLTTYPHAELDIGSGESLIFRVPYCARTPWAKMTDMDWSFVRVSMINAFAGLTGAETCELSIYAWWENVSLHIPIAQGVGEDWDSNARRVAHELGEDNPRQQEAQGGGEAGNDVESEEKTSKPISAAFSALSDFSYMFRFVPVIGPYVAGVSWISGLAARAASAFGYSKPANNSSTQFMSGMPMRGYTHCEGSDDSVILAMRPSNKVSVSPANFGVGKDPHSFRTFLGRDHIIRQTQWTVAMPVDTKLYQTFLAPDLTGQTLLRAFADNFRHYAASLIFRVSLAKNAFYSGRLAVQWFEDANVTASWNPGAPSILLDVKTNNELVFRIPFVANSRVVDTLNPMGVLVIWVVNPLRVNDTYPQSIGVNISMCVDEKMLFSMLNQPVVAYSQGLPDDECVIPEPGALSKTAVDIYSLPPPDPNIYTVVDGEFTNTISDLLKRFVEWFELSTSFNCYFTPSAFYQPYTSAHPISRWSNFYRFWRGSFRYKVVVTRPPLSATGIPDPHAIIFVRIGYSTTYYIITTGTILPLTSDSLPECQVSININNVLEFAVPYYSINDRSVVSMPDVDPVPLVQIEILPSSAIYTVAPHFKVYWAAGEDFSFGFPCGLPKLT